MTIGSIIVYVATAPAELYMKGTFDLYQERNATTGNTLKIGELSKRSGVGIEALRFYEKSGLLDRPERTGSGYRLYGESAVDRLSFIKKAQLLGFSLDEIRKLIDHKRKGENPCSEVRAIVRHRLDDLNERIKQMTKYRNELSAALSEWDERGEAEGHVCGLIEGSTILHSMDQRKLGRNKHK